MNYSLFAESKHLVKAELNKIIAGLENQYSCTIDTFDGNDKEFNLESLLNELNTIPFLSEHKIVILENPLFLSTKLTLNDQQHQQLALYLENPASFSTLIIYVNQFKVDKRKKASRLISKNTKLFEPKALDDNTIKNIIANDLRHLKITLDAQAKNELEKRILSNFDNWENELIKIELYNKNHLSYEDIDVLISRNNFDNVFDLVNGVLNKNLKQSLITYRNLDRGQSEPIGLIMLLANQFRLIHQVKTLMEAKVAYNEMAKHLKVHPYRIQIASNIARSTSSQKLLAVLDNLATLEQNIKMGVINPEIGFELFLIEVHI